VIMLNGPCFFRGPGFGSFWILRPPASPRNSTILRRNRRPSWTGLFGSSALRGTNSLAREFSYKLTVKCLWKSGKWGSTEWDWLGDYQGRAGSWVRGGPPRRRTAHSLCSDGWSLRTTVGLFGIGSRIKGLGRTENLGGLPRCTSRASGLGRVRGDHIDNWITGELATTVG